jgi:hypothetical protein
MDFADFLSRARSRIAGSERAGGYARFPDSEMPDLYGTSAAVGVRIALGDRPTGDDAQRMVEAVRSFQRPDGLFWDPTHGAIHRSATAITTLAALGDSPAVPTALEHLMRPDAAPRFLESLSWEEPWLASHDAAGLLAIGIAAERQTGDQRDRWLHGYLAWLDDHADPVTGLWLGGRMGNPDDDPGLFGNLACSFHLHFLYQHLGRPWPSPDGVVDAGLTLLQKGHVVPPTGGGLDGWGFRQLDWAYSVGRAARAAHRVSEVTAALEMVGVRAAHVLCQPDAAEGDLHVVQARVALVAELSQHLPGAIETDHLTLTSVVDVRPFI